MLNETLLNEAYEEVPTDQSELIKDLLSRFDDEPMNEKILKGAVEELTKTILTAQKENTAKIADGFKC